MLVPLAHAYDESDDAVYCPHRCLPPHAALAHTHTSRADGKELLRVPDAPAPVPGPSTLELSQGSHKPGETHIVDSL
jgi:hypothetical protein